MSIAFGLWLLLLGCLAVKRLPRLRPYRGWIGIASALVGLYEITWMLSSLSAGILRFAVVTAAVICQIVLGFILGIGIVRHFVSDAQAHAKVDQFFDRVHPYQRILGLLAIADGLAVVVLSLVN